MPIIDGYIYAHHPDINKARLNYHDRSLGMLATNQTIQDLEHDLVKIQGIIQLMRDSHKRCEDSQKPIGHIIEQGDIRRENCGIPKIL